MFYPQRSNNPSDVSGRSGFRTNQYAQIVLVSEGNTTFDPCHHIREYEYLYGAVEPLTGENFFLTMPYCNTNHMNAFLRELSKAYKDDIILLVTDGARWHISKTLIVPSNIELLRIPPYTPEMNPIEQVWTYVRTQGFKNLAFQTFAAVEDRLCEIVNLITHEVIKSITSRQWIIDCFL